jgi:hypothetical protein
MKNLTLTPINGEPRIQDLMLGERLGFDRPRDIRKLIVRNIENLNKINQCATVARIPEDGGREVTEYYLDRKQSIFITMKSDAPRAFEVQMEIIEVYDAWQRGDLGREQDDPELVAHLRRTLLAQNPTWAALHRHRLANLPVSQSAKVLECSETTIRQQLRKMDLCGLLPEPIAEPLGARPTTAADHARWLESYTNGTPVTEIAARENRPASTIRRALSRFNGSAQRDLFDAIPEVLA